ERAEVDQAEQPLVQLDLEVGMEILGRKGAGVAGRLELAVLLRPLGNFFRRRLILGLADLPHDQRSCPRAPATPRSIASMSRHSADLRLMEAIGMPRSIAWLIVS